MILLIKKTKIFLFLKTLREKKLKLFEYDLYNLPFSHVKAVLNLMKKQNKSQIAIGSKFNRHKAFDVIKIR